ncbi:hypothetical protein J2X31_000873 [Flavobacterium arsenatis]|uniref:Uncharacterized protein n=1 Tax=Flavobacterium arsenatis TaxID=1484332 RepID=A0ABU1TLX9_9FLAO|nr:hypothetical protein [Flavobacterium arsenatis]MDR6966873.1 hypothetical protein [Flavobacterium arsenatis]
MNLSKRDNRGLYAVLLGLPFSLLLSYFIFKPTSLIDLFYEIADFGINTPLFWGIIYPLIYLVILFSTGRTINWSENSSFFQKVSKFSFSATLKVIAILFLLFLGNKIINGISTTVIPLISVFLFSLIMLLFIIFASAIINFIIGFLTVKLLQKK